MNGGKRSRFARAHCWLKKLGRLFVIKTRFEAMLVIYALALGAAERGSAYLGQYPGWGGRMLFLACTGSVFMAGVKLFDCLRYEEADRQARPFGDEGIDNATLPMKP